jgi:hypothetical protein
MIWYVALVAVLNLGLGYGLAMYLGAGRTRFATNAGDSFGDSEFDAEVDT